MDNESSYPPGEVATGQRVVQCAHDQRRDPPAWSAQKRIVVAALVIVILGALIAGAFLGGLWTLGEEGVSVRGFEELVRSWGPWGVGASIGLMVLHSFVPFPAELLALANGMLYGWFWGTVITWTGAMLGAYLAFGLSRYLGRPFVEVMVPDKHLSRLDDWTARQGGGTLFMSRFLPVISFNFINYAAGLTNISWLTFTWATGVGILPLTILMVGMGDQIEHLSWEMLVALFAAGVVLWWLIFRKLLPMYRARASLGRR